MLIARNISIRGSLRVHSRARKRHSRRTSASKTDIANDSINPVDGCRPYSLRLIMHRSFFIEWQKPGPASTRLPFVKIPRSTSSAAGICEIYTRLRKKEKNNMDASKARRDTRQEKKRKWTRERSALFRVIVSSSDPSTRAPASFEEVAFNAELSERVVAFRCDGAQPVANDRKQIRPQWPGATKQSPCSSLSTPVPRESEEVAHNETKKKKRKKKRGITSLAASRKCEPVVPHYRVRFPCND